MGLGWSLQAFLPTAPAGATDPGIAHVMDEYIGLALSPSLWAEETWTN